MKRGKRIVAVFLYLLTVALLLGLRPWELFDLSQFLLVLAGGIILYLPSMEKEDFRNWRKPDFALLARNTIYASYIETFVLLFLLLYHGPEAGQAPGLRAVQEGGQGVESVSGILMRNIALGFRPLLYGICIWIALGSEEGKEGGENGSDKDGSKAMGNAVEGQGTAGAGAGGSSGGEGKVWTTQECYQYFLDAGLTRRESEVALQICKGISNKEIAMELGISETTVKKHVSNIFEKLGVNRREEIGRGCVTICGR